MNHDYNRDELKAYREYTSTGHIEFFVGLGLVLIALMDILKINPIVMNVIVMALFIPVFEWKKWVVLPRIGHVEFKPGLVKHEAKVGAIVLGILLLLVVSTTIILYVIRDNFRYWFEGSEAGSFLFIGLVATISFLTVAVARKTKVHYLFALLNIGAFAWALLGNFDPMYTLSGLGVVMVVYGGLRIKRFLSEHPKPEYPVIEDDNPEIESEFVKEEKQKSEIYTYYNSDGLNIFMSAVMYFFAGCLNLIHSLRTVLYLFIGFVVVICWRLIVTRLRMGKRNFAVAREIERSRFSPSFSLIGIVPFIVIISLPDYLPKEYNQTYKSFMDILVIGTFSAYLLWLYYRLSLKGQTAMVMYPLLLYVFLRSSQITTPTTALIVGGLVLLVGIMKAIQFLRSTPPQPLEVL